MAFSPTQHIYTTVIEDILSNAKIAATFKPANIVRYDQSNVRFPFKPDAAPADLPELILQMNGITRNRRGSGSVWVEQYDFQATITTNKWHLGQADIAQELMDWQWELNSGRGCGLDWSENRSWFKCEVLPMQIANHMPTNRNLSGFVYAVYFNIQLNASGD